MYPPPPLYPPFFPAGAGHSDSADDAVYGSSGRLRLAVVTGSRLIVKRNSLVDSAAVGSNTTQPSVTADAQVSVLLTMIQCASITTIQDTGWSVLFFGAIGALGLVRFFGTSWFCCFVAKRFPELAREAESIRQAQRDEAQRVASS